MPSQIIDAPLSWQAVARIAHAAARVSVLAHGRSGMRAREVESRVDLLNANLIPVIPRGGSIGYITQMAHIALVLPGSGSVHSGGGILTGRQALERPGVHALVRESKQGLRSRQRHRVQQRACLHGIRKDACAA